MNVTNYKEQVQVYVRKAMRFSKAELAQISIIFLFILVSALISIVLPIYFSRLALTAGW